MDVDFRSHSAKQFAAMQYARMLNSENHLCIDDSEGEDDARASFPCPFCYVDVELPMLCTHLQEEHCFDIKNAVCPLCAANLGKDPIGHFTLQHTQMLKRRRRSQRSGLWPNNSPSILSKELPDLASFLGVTSTNGRGNTHDSSPDPSLSPFLFNAALSDTKTHLDTSSTVDASTSLILKSNECSKPDEVREEEYRERSQRAEFVQQLAISTIF